MSRKKKYPIIVIDGVECKKCAVCGKMKPLTEFWRHRTHNCWQSSCKDCHKVLTRNSLRKTRQEDKERKRRAEELLKVRDTQPADIMQSERLRLINEALAKVAGMKAEKRRKAAAEETLKRAYEFLTPSTRLPHTDEPCRYCKSYSRCGDNKLCMQGFCMKHHVSKRADDTCGDWRPNVKIEYVL